MVCFACCVSEVNKCIGFSWLTIVISHAVMFMLALLLLCTRVLCTNQSVRRFVISFTAQHLNTQVYVMLSVSTVTLTKALYTLIASLPVLPNSPVTCRLVFSLSRDGFLFRLWLGITFSVLMLSQCTAFPKNPCCSMNNCSYMYCIL